MLQTEHPHIWDEMFLTQNNIKDMSFGLIQFVPYFDIQEIYKQSNLVMNLG